MTKSHFKYAYGYINVDEDNVYFTSTGNWQETKGLKEKGVSSSEFLKRIIFGLFILIYLIFALHAFVYSKENLKLAGIGLVLMLLPIVRMINNSSSDVKFYIPKSKIYEIQIEPTVIWLKFYSKDKAAQNFYIQQLEANEQEFVERIKSPYTLLKFT